MKPKVFTNINKCRYGNELIIPLKHTTLNQSIITTEAIRIIIIKIRSINVKRPNVSLPSPWFIENKEVRDIVPCVAVVVEVVHGGLQRRLQGVWVILK